VLQGVLGKPIGKVMGSRYQVSGTWEKPVITLIAREAQRRAQPGAGSKPEPAPETKPAAPETKPAAPEARPEAKPAATDAQLAGGKLR
jgi:hypothetical protein